MEHRRVAWAACVVAVTTLGLSGLIAQGCSDDDNSTMPTGTGGSGGSGGAGTGGKAGGTTGTAGKGGSSAGTAGTAGTAGSAGGKVDSGVSDAPTEAQVICSGTLDSGSSCVDSCLCTNCASQALACLGVPACRALVDCAGAMGCGVGTVADQLNCARTKCGAELDAGIAFITQATALGACLGTAMCLEKCTPDGGGTDAPASDARPDSPATDAPATDSTTSDTTTTDTTTTDATTTDTTTTDEAAAEAAAEAGGD